MALVGVALLWSACCSRSARCRSTPDSRRYRGTDAVTGFMAAATKVAAFGALLRVVTMRCRPCMINERPVLWAIAILTMTVSTHRGQPDRRQADAGIFFGRPH